MVLLISFMSLSQEYKPNIVGKIKIEKNDNFLNLRAQVFNKEQIYVSNLSYNLVAVKKDATGNYSKNNQSGSFSLSPEEEKHLAMLRINLTNKDELKAYLFVKYKEKLVYRDTFFIVPKNSKKQYVKRVKKEVNEFDFAIKGIVLDETKTRIGREYHDFFYKEYVVSGRKYPFVIAIKEKPALGSSSILSVEVEGRKVHEFFVKPEEEYLKGNVAQAMKRLTRFARVRKTIRRM